MIRTSVSVSAILATLALGSAAKAQILVTYNATTDTLVAFSPVDGTLLDANYFPVTATVNVSAIDVNGEVWVSEQSGDRVVRYDRQGNVLGQIGPVFPGGGFDNIRGISLINGIVYVTNDGTGNGATANSLVLLDTAGNHVSTVVLTNTASPFSVMAWQGDILVADGSGVDTEPDVYRYTPLGAPVSLFHNSLSTDAVDVDFAHQISQASDGNVWCAGFSSNNVCKLDATTGAILTSFAASGARGVYELQNGKVMWTGTGVHIWDPNTNTSSTVLSGGSSYHLNLIMTQHAFHVDYGTGCHDQFVNSSNLFQLFPDVTTAKATLEGNAMRYTKTANGYIADWLPGAAAGMYVAPTGGATVIADADSTTTVFAPSAPIPVPSGTVATWTVSSNGVLTADNPGNQGTSGAPTLSSTASQTRLAWYTWSNFNPVEVGSGKIKWEEVSGVVYVTFDGVEITGTPTVAPSTFQWQINVATGEVVMLWTSLTGSTMTTDVLVGCTLAGAGQTPVSQPLSAASGHVMRPDTDLLPLTLSASPAPIINPSTLVNYTISNAPETAPGSGLYLSLMFLSVNPFVPGIDLTGILTSAPGCKLYLGTLDLGLGAAVTVVPTNLVQFTYSTPIFAPGNVIGAQAVALFDATFPLANGESSGYLVSNGVMSTIRAQ